MAKKKPVENIITTDPITKRFAVIEKLLQQFMQSIPTTTQLQQLIIDQYDAIYKAKFQELDDLRTECVRLLKILREKAENSPPVSQQELNNG